MAEAFNTLQAARQLQNAGCEQRVAEEVANQINGAISGTVATKSDIERLGASTKADFERLEASTKADFERLETSTKADIGLLRKDMEVMDSGLRTEIQSVRTEMAKQHTRLILWVAGLGGVLLTLSKLYELLF